LLPSTADAISASLLLIHALAQANPAAPVLFTEWKKIDPRRGFAQFLFDLQHQFLLMVAAQLADKGAVLYTIQPIVQAEIRDLGAYFVVRYIVDQ
jgi:hypothetical protein